MRITPADLLLGEIVRECRLDAQDSQTTLCNKLWRFRWHQSTVNKLETGQRRFTFAEAVALARVYKLDLSAIAAACDEPDVD